MKRLARLTREQKALRRHSENVLIAVHRKDTDFWNCEKAFYVAMHYRDFNNKK